MFLEDLKITPSCDTIDLSYGHDLGIVHAHCTTVGDEALQEAQREILLTELRAGGVSLDISGITVQLHATAEGALVETLNAQYKDQHFDVVHYTETTRTCYCSASDFEIGTARALGVTKPDGMPEDNVCVFALAVARSERANIKNKVDCGERGKAHAWAALPLRVTDPACTVQMVQDAIVNETFADSTSAPFIRAPTVAERADDIDFVLEARLRDAAKAATVFAEKRMNGISCSEKGRILIAHGMRTLFVQSNSPSSDRVGPCLQAMEGVNAVFLEYQGRDDVPHVLVAHLDRSLRTKPSFALTCENESFDGTCVSKLSVEKADKCASPTTVETTTGPTTIETTTGPTTIETTAEPTAVETAEPSTTIAADTTVPGNTLAPISAAGGAEDESGVGSGTLFVVLLLVCVCGVLFAFRRSFAERLGLSGMFAKAGGKGRYTRVGASTAGWKPVD